MSEEKLAEMLLELSMAGIPARCVQLVSELGVADCIGDEPLQISAVADQLGVNGDALDRVLRLLAGHGIFKRDGGTYAHTPASRLLREDHPMSVRAFVRLAGQPGFWGSLTNLEYSVRTGSPAITTVDPRGLWAYLQDHPTEAQIFGQAMTAKAHNDIAAVLSALSFAGFNTVADIGGGRGHLLGGVLDSNPNVQGILFDLPTVIDSLVSHQSRLTTVCGDFFVDSLPAADAYLIMEVLHDWGDDEAIAILKAIRRSAKPRAKLFIIESVLAEQTNERADALDIVMLTITGGRERTVGQLRRFMQQSGFEFTGVIETPGPMTIIQGSAA